jgi:beta-glucosidase
VFARFTVTESCVSVFVRFSCAGSQEFIKTAYNAAAESITLLKNKNTILPCKNEKKILVTGPTANSMVSLNGGWTYTWQGEKTDEIADKFTIILEALQKKWVLKCSVFQRC